MSPLGRSPFTGSKNSTTKLNTMHTYYNQENLSEAHVNPEVYEEDTQKSPERLIAERAADVMSKTIDFIVSSKSPLVAVWAVANATGAACCEGVKCSDRAAILKISPQALSKQTLEFADIIGIKPVYGYDKKS